MLTYRTLVNSFNQKMLGGQADRVTLLKKVLESLGHPDHQYRIVHLAGTNGKGSTGSMIQQTLQTAGYRVGYFSSPALLDQREQIRVNDQMISPVDFVRTYQKINEQLPAQIQPGMISAFEWWTLIMLQYFADQQVDWAVIECGLGGRDDATNVIDPPDLAVITHVALDHTKILGPSLADIAQAKAGIIKQRTQAVILAPHQQSIVETTMKKRSQAQQVPLLLASEVQLIHQKQEIEFQVGKQRIRAHLNLLGTFQFDNVRTAAMAINWFIQQNILSDWRPFTQAISRLQIPGRMQMISQDPVTILDGAHNPDAAHQLVATLRPLIRNRRLIMIIGFLADKQWQKMVDNYRQLADQLIVTTPQHPTRALSLDVLHHYVPEAVTADNGVVALATARQLARPNDIIVVTGSFYLIKELEAEV